MVGPERPQFVLFGSSIVQFSFSNQGWGAILADIYARKDFQIYTDGAERAAQSLTKCIVLDGVKFQKDVVLIKADIILRGYAGWNSRAALEVLSQIFPKDAPVQPTLVIVYFGGNDSMKPHPSGLGPHVPLNEYIENMKKIASHLKSLSEKTRIIFLSAPPINEAKIRESESLSVFGDLGRTNEACRKYSEACIKLCEEIGVKVIDLWTSLQKRDDWLTACFTDGIHLSSEGSKIVVKEILKVLKEADWEPSLHWNSLPTEFSETSACFPVGPDGKTTINISEATFHREMQWD